MFGFKVVAFVLAWSFVGGQIAVAQELTAEYVQGTVEVQSGTAWKAVSIGESINPRSALRVGQGSLVELTGSGSSILVSAAGVYQLTALLDVSRMMRPPGLEQTLTSVLAGLVGLTDQTQSGSTGIRSENQSKDIAMQWFNSPSQVYLEGGKQYIESHQYAQAVGQLKKGLKIATRDEKPELHFYLAYAYSLEGNPVSALKEIGSFNPIPGAPWFPDLILLKARLLLDSFAFQAEVALLTKYSAVLETDVHRAPLYRMLLALGYRGLGNKGMEKQNLEHVVELAPDSDLAREAKDLLQSL